MKLYAVIPTHNRHDDLAELLDSIPADVHVLVIDNASTPPVAERQFNDAERVMDIDYVRDEEQPPNLSRLWNIGLDWAARRFDPIPECRAQRIDDYAVAILNDDVLLPPGFLNLMARELEAHKTDIAFPGRVGERCHVNNSHMPPGVHMRMTGWCFVVRGSSGLRADERLRWWCGDDDLERSAAMHGRGVVRVGLTAEQAKGLLHKYPDQSTAGVLREQTARDMATFVTKWGCRPW